MRKKQKHQKDSAMLPVMDADLEGAKFQDAESEFGRFEDLTRKLLRVPKKELDEKRKKG